MKIKVCGLKIPTNISAMTQLEIDFIGFSFVKDSPRYFSLDKAAFGNIEKLKTSTLKKVGVFKDESISVILEKVKTYQLDFVQLNGNENLFYCSKLKGKGIKIIKLFEVNEHFTFSQTKAYQFYCAHFVFNFQTNNPNKGGNAKLYDWRILERYKGTIPFFLSGGIKPSMAKAVNEFTHPRFYGVNINSGFEIEPGYKSVAAISEFINHLDQQVVSDW